MEKGGGMLLSQVKQLSDRVFAALLRENDLTFSNSQGRLLYVLWKEDGLTMSELSRRTYLTNNTLTIVIETMVRSGLVQRGQNPHNRREVLVTLTPKAKEARESYQKVSDEMTDIYYAGFTGEERQQLETYLERLLGNLKKAEEDKL